MSAWVAAFKSLGRGCSPLVNAGLTASMLGRLERRMAQETNARVGHLLTVPDGTSEEQVYGVAP